MAKFQIPVLRTRWRSRNLHRWSPPSRWAISRRGAGSPPARTAGLRTPDLDDTVGIPRLSPDSAGEPALPAWDIFGKLSNSGDDQPDPQRAVSTSFISRAGASALVVISNDGDIDSARNGETGFYVDDMRIVSLFRFRLNGAPCRLQSSSTDSTLSYFAFTYCSAAHDHIGLTVTYTFGESDLWISMETTNSGSGIEDISIDVDFAADFFDTFYVRFPPKGPRGTLHPAKLGTSGQSVEYDTLDGRRLRSAIEASEHPVGSQAGTMRFVRTLQSGETWKLVFQAGAQASTVDVESWTKAWDVLKHSRLAAFAGGCNVRSTNADVNSWLTRAEADLSIMTVTLDTGPYPVAGLPWFAVPFGRDGLITGLQTLQFSPQIMKGVLLHHAKYQATEIDTFRQAWPGKTMHERRLGETSRARLNPFYCYYGSVDTTILFVICVHAYWVRSGDDALLRSLWPQVDLALQWMSDYGDQDGDGFIEYAADPGQGLANQGWKDSWDAIMHEDGTFPRGPIALCEVQGYAYSAWRAGSEMATALGFEKRAEFCGSAAEVILARFDASFWQEDKGYYALALDGDKNPCRVRASNMVHLPWCEVVPAHRAASILADALSAPLFSGWGIRTLAAGEARYKPDLYHRGPCWPHEMAIAAWSASNVRSAGAVESILSATLETAKAFNYRLPELFCGYEREAGVAPVEYKSANLIQAWTAGIPFSLIQSALGIVVDGRTSHVTIDPLGLPPEWGDVTVENVQVGAGSFSVKVSREASGKHAVKIVRSEGATFTIADNARE